MDLQDLAQLQLDIFNDRTFRERAAEFVDPNVVTIDVPQGQELQGLDAYLQYSEGYITTMPDIQGQAVEHQVSGNTVTTRIRGIGTFTGQLETPDGTVPGNGNGVDLEYQAEWEFNADGKLARFTLNYDMGEFMSQLGLG